MDSELPVTQLSATGCLISKISSVASYVTFKTDKSLGNKSVYFSVAQRIFLNVLCAFLVHGFVFLLALDS